MLPVMDEKKIREWQKRIDEIKQELVSLGDMRPGSISQQYNVCGNPSCRCKDPVKPRKHGPYAQLSYVHRGKSTSEFVRKENLEATTRQVANYHLFRELTQEWVDLALKIAKERNKRS
jgi:hypothetical protein